MMKNHQSERRKANGILVSIQRSVWYLFVSFFLRSHNLKFTKQIIKLWTLHWNHKQNVTQRRLNASLPIWPPKRNIFLFQTCCRSPVRRGDGMTAKFSTILDYETFGYHKQFYQSYKNEKSLKKFDKEKQEEELIQTSRFQRHHDASFKYTFTDNQISF